MTIFFKDFKKRIFSRDFVKKWLYKQMRPNLINYLGFAAFYRELLEKCTFTNLNKLLCLMFNLLIHQFNKNY